MTTLLSWAAAYYVVSYLLTGGAMLAIYRLEPRRWGRMTIAYALGPLAWVYYWKLNRNSNEDAGSVESLEGS